MEDKTRKQRDRIKHFTREQVAAVAAEIQRLRDDAVSFSEALNKTKFDGTLPIDGGEKMSEALEWLWKWLNGARTAFDLAQIPVLDDIEDEPDAKRAKPKK